MAAECRSDDVRGAGPRSEFRPLRESHEIAIWSSQGEHMESRIRATAIGVIAGSVLLASPAAAARERWTPAAAGSWYAGQPWMVGANYIPASAINQLEMWQAETFDPRRIDTELGWAEATGMSTMRVFLHDLLWRQDAAGFKARID